jgi:hypothetical protein
MHLVGDVIGHVTHLLHSEPIALIRCGCRGAFLQDNLPRGEAHPC